MMDIRDIYNVMMALIRQAASVIGREMLKILFLILILPLVAFGQPKLDSEGYYYLGGGKGYNFYINAEDFKLDETLQNKAVVDVWIKFSYVPADDGTDSTVSQLAINCKNEEMATIQFFAYYNGDMVTSYSVPRYLWNFESLPPGTNANAIQKFVCNGKFYKLLESIDPK